MPRYILTKSDKPDKKWLVITPEGKKVRFGGSGYEDFTIHKDKDRKENYLKRHKKTEDWNDLDTSGAWSRWLLWNKPSLRESIRDMNDRFNIHIIKVRRLNDNSRS